MYKRQRLAKFQEDDVFGAFLALEDFYISVTAEIGRKKENRGSILVAEVQDYLRRDYADAGISVATVAVSYTHLDVYKRQLLGRAGALPRISDGSEFRGHL